MFKAEQRREWLGQLVKFGLVGVLNTLIDIAVFALLIVLSVHYATAQAAAYLAGMANSYYMNSVFTFRTGNTVKASGGNWGRRWRFLVWNASMLALSVLLLALLTEFGGMHEMIAKLAVTLLVLAVNFYGSKRWVFAERNNEVAGTEGSG